MSCVARTLRCLISAALLCGSGQAALAQSLDTGLRLETEADDPDLVLPPPPPPQSARITIGDDDEPVLRRRKKVVDAYAAPGLRAGAFLLFPSLELSTVTSSNVRKSTTGRQADVGLRLKPQLRFESDWVRHSLTGAASFTGEQFLDNTDIKSRNGEANAKFRLDIRRTTTAEFDTSYTATSVGLEDSEIPATATGARLDQSFGAVAAIRHDLGGVEARLRLGVSRNIYGDVDLTGGGKQDNSDRDYTQLSLAARATLNTGAIVDPFAEVAFEPRIHDQKTDRSGLKRDSQSVRVALGVNIADDPVWIGDIAATLERRDYSDSSLETVLAPGVAANLIWQPSDLTRFEFTAGATLAEAASAGVSASQNWNVGVDVSHALRENLQLVGGLKASFERSDGSTDITTVGNAGVNWIVNPYVVLSTGYEGTFFNGATAGSNYVDHRVLTSIILRH
jgi:hypothetical protein